MHQPPVFLFVYGTLRQGYAGEQASILASQATFISTAEIPGALYYVGHLSNGKPYPGLVMPPHTSDSTVSGDLWLLQNPTELLTYMDSYESITGDPTTDEYARELHPVKTPDQRLVLAWIYRWLRPILPLNRIPSGDFLSPK